MIDEEGLAILHRLRRLHAMALGLYLVRRLMGEEGEPHKKRLLWIEDKILIMNDNGRDYEQRKTE